MLRKYFAAAATVVISLSLVGVAALPAHAGPPEEAQANSGSFWQVAEGELCEKVADNYTDATYEVPSGIFPDSTITKVILKSASGDDSNDVLYIDASYLSGSWGPHANPIPVAALRGETFAHSGGQDISHVIVCHIPKPDPEAVSGAAAGFAPICDEQTYTITSGYITVTPTTGVTYQLWDSDKAVLIEDNYTGGSHPSGPYQVKVLATTADYTVSDAHTWIAVTIPALVGECEADDPIEVRGAAAAFDQTCSEELLPVAGFITVTPTAGVTYQLWNSDKSELLEDDYTGGSHANGTYQVKVLPANGTYTVLPDDEWIEVEISAVPRECDNSATAGGHFATELCSELPELASGVFQAAALEVTIQYFTVVAGDGVTYTWELNGVDQGPILPGEYPVGPTELVKPGDTVEVFAHAIDPRVLTGPASWTHTFDLVVCLDTLPPVSVEVSSTPLTCTENGTVTLGVVGDVNEAVDWTINGAPFQEGTHPVTEPGTLEIVATALPPYGFDGVEGLEIVFEETIDAPDTDCDLETLALTGADDPAPAVALAALLALLGAAFLRAQSRIRQSQKSAA